MKSPATLTVNGVAYPVELEPGTTLLTAVRDVVGLTGSKEGCDDSECGACMMLLDGKPVNACSYLALQAEGAEITTVDGKSKGAIVPQSFLNEAPVVEGARIRIGAFSFDPSESDAELRARLATPPAKKR